MISAPRQLTKTRLDADDPTVAERFRALDEARRRRLACSMVRDAIAEHGVTLPPTILGLLGTAGPPVESDFRRSRIVAAARYALSPQPRACEEAVHEALRARASFEGALVELRRRLD